MTDKPIDLLTLIERLPLSLISKANEAGLWTASLPWPRQAPCGLSLDQAPAHAIPLGKWPDSDSPRRLLLFGDSEDGMAPETLFLDKASPSKSSESPKKSAVMERFERSPEGEYIWERHFLKLRHGDREIGIAMGLRTGNTVHWWEACRLVTIEETDSCLVVEMGGAIPVAIMTSEEMNKYPGFINPYLHKHNWLNGRIYARLHTNGVCEVYAHHINSKFFDDGLELKDVVPVIGFRGKGDPFWVGSCDGTRTDWALGKVKFDLTEAVRLSSPTQPGKIEEEGGFVVFQPYTGAEIYGGDRPLQTTGDPFVHHAEEKTFPRGMARTIRFSLSLSERSPCVARYLAPAWWYGLCEEFVPESLLPVSNQYDALIDRSRKWIHQNIVRGGFEDGSLPRHADHGRMDKGRIRREPGWEGEIPYAQFLCAWRTGDRDDYECALQSAYYFSDVVVDHAAKSVRHVGHREPAFALPMNRMQGTIAAYLETGDPYLLEIAEAVTLNSHWHNKNSWPRLAMGRDACYIRSAVLLHRYFGKSFYREVAAEGVRMVIQTQRDNGTFGDQGGGTGLHQWAGYITKPWMGLLALNGVLDYVELFPDEDAIQAIKKFADWLMDARWEHQGARTWSYQHDYDGGSSFPSPHAGKTIPLPTLDYWHQETLARFLGYSAFTFNDSKYLSAWAESSEKAGPRCFDHGIAAILQFIPWLQAKLWNAKLTPHGISLHPVGFGPATPRTAKILAPGGSVAVDHS